MTRAEHPAGFDVVEATIADVHAAFAAGTLTARGLVEAHLERIAAFDQAGPKLNAIVRLASRALDEADALDEQLRRTGALAGPLHGIPVLLKDNVGTKDLPTTGGSLALAGHVPAEDATVVRKLRAAGAIVLGKANLHELAVWGETVSSILGQTLNPYDLTRTPGGSSGGTGAGLAASFAMLGVGTDTVNSIRSPASANGLVGIRATLGLVSRAGVIPFSPTQDVVGPLARTVEDATRMLNVLAGYDPGDPATAWSVGHVEPDYTRHLRRDGAAGKRLGVLRSFFGAGERHREVNRVADRAIEDVARLGATIVELETPPLDSGRIVSEVSVHLHELRPALDGYLASTNAPVGSLRAVLASGKLHPGVRDDLEKAERLEGGDAYRVRLQARAELQLLLMQLIAERRLDALVYPHQQRLVVPVGETQAERNGALSAVTGFPAVVVPAGFSTPTATAPIGVPIGLELLGRPWSESVLVALAYAYEQATRRRRPPPTAPALGLVASR